MYSCAAATTLALFGTGASVLSPTANQTDLPSCRNIPGDAGWPQAQNWADLNNTVNGRLIATVPLGHVCHDPTFDEAKCNELTAKWGLAATDAPVPGEFMALWFQNNTCTPFTSSSTPCILGNYASYSIDVRSIDDARAGIRFAQDNNIRLVIKNSGSDFYGQNTGKGALSLWVHNYNQTTIDHNYTSAYYNGPALRVETGAESAAAQKYAAQHGYAVVSGACPNVKLAGGYLGGGGHSYLSSTYGFGADNALEYEVVTADGKRVIATPIQNSDLYWALSGGGPGSFGVVLSATVRVFPAETMSSAAFSFNYTQAGGVEQYWNAVNTFHEQIKPLLDDGMVAEYGLTNETISVTGILAPGLNGDKLQSALQPLVQAITDKSCSQLTAESLGMTIDQADSYYDLYYKAGIEAHNAAAVFPAAIAGRLVPRKAMEGNTSNLNYALRAIAERGYGYAVIALNATSPVRNRIAPPIAPNAVQPSFTDAFSSLMIAPQWSNSMPWSQAKVLQDQLIDEILPLYDSYVPNAGAYKNEANWQEKDIKAMFYGSTYARLEKIKKQVDPEGFFYGITSVGFDEFEFDGDGRLCKVTET